MTGLFLYYLLYLGLSTCYSEVNDHVNPYDFLVKYGYMQKNAYSSTKEAIRKMQAFANINVTGILDDETIGVMNSPRCGIADHEGVGYYGSRRWRKSDLTYRIENYTPDLSKDDVDRIIQEAFQVWADYVPLRFTQIESEGDFSIVFGSYRHKGAWGQNGQGYCSSSFDGRGRVLAHAYFPPDGRAHFDESETFTDKTSRGINLFWVAAHEFGHALGLPHSRVKSALMYPYYRGYRTDFHLDYDDIKRMTDIYGRRGTLPPGQTYPPRPTRGTRGTRGTYGPEPTHSGDCVDKRGTSHCKARISICRTSHSGWREYMRMYCYKTCYCNGIGPDYTNPPVTWKPTPMTLKPSKEPVTPPRKSTSKSGGGTKATQATKVTGRECVDKAGRYCINHKKNGKCDATDEKWKSYMRRNCFKSCFC